MKLRGDLDTMQSKYDGANAELKIKQEELNAKEYNIDENVNYGCTRRPTGRSCGSTSCRAV